MAHRQLARAHETETITIEGKRVKVRNMRQLGSPLTAGQLRDPPESYDRLQVDGELTEKDCKLLDRFLAEHPEKPLRVWHRHTEPMYDLAFLRWLPALRVLSIEAGAGELPDLSSLTALPNGIDDLLLDTLARYSEPSKDRPKRDLHVLARLSKLRNLILCTRLKDLAFLSQLAPLCSLSLWRCRLKDLRGIEAQSGLERLELATSGVIDLGPLQALEHLRCLSVSDHRGLRDLRTIAGLASLRELSLSFTAQGANLPGDWSGLIHLQKLRLTSVPSATDLRFVQRLPALRHLVLSGMDHLENPDALSALRGHPTLQFIGLNVWKPGHAESLEQASGIPLRPAYWNDGDPLECVADRAG